MSKLTTRKSEKPKTGKLRRLRIKGLIKDSDTRKKTKYFNSSFLCNIFHKNNKRNKKQNAAINSSNLELTELTEQKTLKK